MPITITNAAAPVRGWTRAAPMRYHADDRIVVSRAPSSSPRTACFPISANISPPPPPPSPSRYAAPRPRHAANTSEDAAAAK